MKIIGCNISIVVIFALFSLNEFFIDTAIGASGKVTCESISSTRLMEMMQSEKKVEIIDYRFPEDYYSGHIENAILFSRKNKVLMRLKIEKMILKWIREGVTGVFVDEDGSRADVFCRNMKLIFKYENIYSLNGGMMDWEGSLEREYIFICYKKIKGIWNNEEYRPLLFITAFLGLMSLLVAFIKKL